MCIPTIRELPYMTDFLKIAKSIVVHFAHILCVYGVETVKPRVFKPRPSLGLFSSCFIKPMCNCYKVDFN